MLLEVFLYGFFMLWVVKHEFNSVPAHMYLENIVDKSSFIYIITFSIQPYLFSSMFSVYLIYFPGFVIIGVKVK